MLLPLRDFVVVTLNKEDEKVAGGLLFRPTTVEESIVTGKVVAVGSGHLTDSGQVVPLEVNVGDVVVFSKHSSVEVKDQGESFLLLREDAVLSIVK